MYMGYAGLVGHQTSAGHNVCEHQLKKRLLCGVGQNNVQPRATHQVLTSSEEALMGFVLERKRYNGVVGIVDSLN
jgi:hypothetical protein